MAPDAQSAKIASTCDKPDDDVSDGPPAFAHAEARRRLRPVSVENATSRKWTHTKNNGIKTVKLVCAPCGASRDRQGKKSCTACADREKDRRKLERRTVFEHYGLECACCGESTYEFLEIDHINGDGASHRRAIGVSVIYRWLIRHEFRGVSKHSAQTAIEPSSDTACALISASQHLMENDMEKVNSALLGLAQHRVWQDAGQQKAGIPTTWRW